MTGDAELYPQYCHHLAPTFGHWCLLPITVIRHLESLYDVFERQNVFFHRNLPIHYARIVGVIVAIDDFPGRHVFTIDDGSGACIETNVQVTKKPAALQFDGATQAYSFAPPQLLFKVPECASLDVGQVVDIKGSLSTFRGEMTMQILKVKILQSTEDEVVLWERRTAFQRDVLSKPWVLTERQVRRCRKEAEEDKKVKQRKSRKRGEEARKILEEAAVDGFGRPQGNRAAGRVPLMDKKANSGDALPNVAREPRSVQPTACQAKPNPPKAEFDGFGRPSGQKPVRRPQVDRQRTAVEAGPTRPRAVEAIASQQKPKSPKTGVDGFGRRAGSKPVRRLPDHRQSKASEVVAGKPQTIEPSNSQEQRKPLKPELDGFGRSAGRKPRRQLPEDSQSKAAEAGLVQVRESRDTVAPVPREHSRPSANPELDGFGRSANRKPNPRPPIATRGEPAERTYRQLTPQHHQVPEEQDSLHQDSDVLDGFGRSKRRRQEGVEVPATPDTSKKRHAQGEQSMVGTRRGSPQVASRPDGVGLDGFGRPKRPKRLS
ncbi:hypothetical protein B0T11DRAFT_275694 [Plectosphaerella cucumerina]|uniref:CST complex subunit Stn1 N-terminal domain-containing protein n=1 Tax=Plectosphaerella cucumerina TaxID=40658 RepID=A0A8K0TN67_9PEZI|nr:hypothetical protein B0T11DRAFT_275694 [Plectosphaerella cucumerina]